MTENERRRSAMVIGTGSDEIQCGRAKVVIYLHLGWIGGNESETLEREVPICCYGRWVAQMA